MRVIEQQLQNRGVIRKQLTIPLGQQHRKRHSVVGVYSGRPRCHRGSRGGVILAAARRSSPRNSRVQC